MLNFDKITPRNVMELRTRFMAGHEAMVVDTLLSGGIPAEEAAYYRAFYQHAASAEVVIWRDEILKLATSGHEVFYDHTPKFQESSQLWCIEGSDWKFTLDVEGPFAWVSVVDGGFYVIGFGANASGAARFVRYVIKPGENTGNGRYDKAAFVALRAFLDTSIAELEVCPVEPSVAKHWAKRNIYLPTIKTVVLRRMQREARAIADESKSVAWSHRWHVRPHWAIRACGPERSDRRRVFIEGYLKGPEDKPIVLKDTIFRATR